MVKIYSLGDPCKCAASIAWTLLGVLHRSVANFHCAGLGICQVRLLAGYINIEFAQTKNRLRKSVYTNSIFMEVTQNDLCDNYVNELLRPAVQI